MFNRVLILGSALAFSLTGTAVAQTKPVTPDADALAATKHYEQTGQARIIERPNYVSFPYGHGQPELRCAPLRSCMVQLEEGETLLGKVVSDPERWFVGPTMGPNNSTLVVIKPKDCNITTDITLTTERRIYQMLATVPPCPEAEKDQNPEGLAYTPLLRFYYPDDVLVEYQQAQARVRAAQRAEEVRQGAPEVPSVGGASVPPAAMDGAAGAMGAASSMTIPVASRGADPAMMDFDYKWQRDRRYPWVPQQVWDDGYHTYIRLPEKAREFETPILFELAPDGSMAIVNYAVRRQDTGDVYVVDRVLHRGVLVVGAGNGGDEQRLLVIKDRKD